MVPALIVAEATCSLGGADAPVVALAERLGAASIATLDTQQIPSLKTVIYVWQDRRQIEVRERTGDGVCQAGATTGPRQVARLEALRCNIDVDALYAGAGS